MITPSIEDIRTDRQFKALTGMSHTEFEQFLPKFTEAYEELRQEAYEAKESSRQRKPGGGQRENSLRCLKNYSSFSTIGKSIPAMMC